MPKPGQGLKKLNHTNECHVGVGLEPGGEKIRISRDTFWVSKLQKDVVEWFCHRKETEPNHEHGKGSPCFTIVFDKGPCPFKSSKFTSNDRGYACSDEVRDKVLGDEKTIYQYRVTMKGKEDLDPGGGVKP